jgi:hypothetical protein
MVPYIAGTILHIVRLVYDFEMAEIPLEVDWCVVIMGGYGGLGLVIFRNKVPFTNGWDKIAYGLLIFHLDGSVIIHASILLTGSHDILNIFPYWYSYIAVGYFSALGLYVYNLNKRLYTADEK